MCLSWCYVSDWFLSLSVLTYILVTAPPPKHMMSSCSQPLIIICIQKQNRKIIRSDLKKTQPVTSQWLVILWLWPSILQNYTQLSLQNLNVYINHINYSTRQHSGTVVRIVASQQESPELNSTITPGSFCVEFAGSLAMFAWVLSGLSPKTCSLWW